MNEGRAALGAWRGLICVVFALLAAGCGRESRSIPETSMSAATPALTQRTDVGAGSPQIDTPLFCERVKTAYARLFEVKNKDAKTQQQAAFIAAQSFREAAKAAPGELSETLQGLAGFYEQVAIGSNVGFRAIQDLLGNSNRLREAVRKQCEFAIDAEPY